MAQQETTSHVTVNNLQFDFSNSLQQAVVEKWDARSDLSPILSPILDGVAFNDLPDFSDLSDLSPLSSSDSSRDLLPPFNQTPLEGLKSLERKLIDNQKTYKDIAKGEEDTATQKAPLKDTATSDAKPAATSRNAKRKSRRQASYRAYRKKSRREQSSAIDSHYEGRENAKKKYTGAAAPIVTDYSTQDAHVSSTGFTGVKDRAKSKKIYTLDELVGESSKFGLRLIKWDGRKTMSILDKDRRVVAILAGHPDDPDWASVHADAAEALEARRNQIHVSKKKVQHRRGGFPALRCGVSHGGGQRQPSNLQNAPANDKILQELNNHPSFRRMAGFASSVMATWTPDLHKYYRQTINKLHANDSSLLRIFPSSIFCAASYNFGPRTVCYRHKDFGNLPFGLCAITSLGTFDPTKGGHMILWDLGLVIEFPPGSTILLPSAIVAHGNTAIARSERRYSFAQYTAGAVFRWIDNDCSTRETYLSTLTPEEREDDEKQNGARWAFGLSLLPIVPLAK